LQSRRQSLAAVSGAGEQLDRLCLAALQWPEIAPAIPVAEPVPLGADDLPAVADRESDGILPAIMGPGADGLVAGGGNLGGLGLAELVSLREEPRQVDVRHIREVI